MRKNGSISFEVSHDGGKNEHGEPIQASSEWSEPIYCSIKTNSDNRKGKYEDGNFRQASFVVLMETQEIPTGSNRVKLTRLTEDLGEYDIINIEPLLTVGRLQILV